MQDEETGAAVGLTTQNRVYGLHTIAEHPRLMRRRYPVLRGLAGAAATAGAGVVVLGQWGVAAAFSPWGLAVLLLAGPAYAILALLPRPEVAARDGEDQHGLWRRIQTRFLLYDRIRQSAIASIWLGLGIAAIGSLGVGLTWGTAAAGVGALTMLLGVLGWASIMVRRVDTIELARQTLMLVRLEEQGLAPAGTLDPRVRRVLHRLDEVLADVPDSTLARFLESEESSLYLQLLAEARDE